MCIRVYYRLIARPINVGRKNQFWLVLYNQADFVSVSYWSILSVSLLIGLLFIGVSLKWLAFSLS